MEASLSGRTNGESGLLSVCVAKGSTDAGGKLILYLESYLEYVHSKVPTGYAMAMVCPIVGGWRCSFSFVPFLVVMSV